MARYKAYGRRFRKKWRRASGSKFGRHMKKWWWLYGLGVLFLWFRAKRKREQTA